MDALSKVTTAQAAKELKTTILDVQEGLIQKELPIGYAQRRRGKSRYNYVIYRGLLDSYKKKITEGNLFDSNCMENPMSGEEGQAYETDATAAVHTVPTAAQALQTETGANRDC